MNQHKTLKHSLHLSSSVEEKVGTKFFAAIFTIGIILVTVLAPSFAASQLTREIQLPTSGRIGHIAVQKLHADGRWLRDLDGNIVQLVGYAGGVQTMSVTSVGLWERDGSTQHFDWVFDEQAIIDNLDAMKASGANSIRSHLAMWFIKNDGIYTNPDTGQPIQYKQNLRRIIELAGERSIYVILDGMTVTPDFLGGGGQDALPYPPYQDHEPDQTLAQSVISDKQDFVDLWLELALYLKDLPNVIFEPWNEAHEPAGYNKTTVMNEWFDVLHDLVATFRANGIDHPIVIQWGYGPFINTDYPDSPHNEKVDWIPIANSTIADPIQNLIFSTHLYRTGGAFGAYSLGQARSDYDGIKEVMQWELIDEMASSYPLLMGEIGASIWKDPENETVALANCLQILNEWQISWLVYWWRLELEWTLFNGQTWIPPFNANGIVVRDAMLGAG